MLSRRGVISLISVHYTGIDGRICTRWFDLGAKALFSGWARLSRSRLFPQVHEGQALVKFTSGPLGISVAKWFLENYTYET
jgi:hypothetical protein